MSSPIKRKISTPILSSSLQAQNLPFPSNSQYFQTNTGHAYSSTKRITEYSQVPTIREEDSFKASAGTSTRLSVDLPKLFFLKSLQNTSQVILKKTIKVTEIPQEVSEVIKSSIIKNNRSQIQGQKRNQSGNQTMKFNPQKGFNRATIKALVTNNSFKDMNRSIIKEIPGDTQIKKFQTEPSEAISQPGIHFKIQKTIEDSSKKKRRNTKVMDIRNIVQRNFEYTFSKFQQKSTQFQDIEETENKIQNELAKINVIKDDKGLSEKVKVYRRHRDIASHFDRSMSNHGSHQMAIRNNSFNKKISLNGDSRDSRDRSLEENSHLFKSYALDWKRDSDLNFPNFCFRENRTRINKKRKQFPFTFLEKSQIGRNNSSASIFLVDNDKQNSIAIELTEDFNARETPLEFSIKTKNMKEKSPGNLHSLPTEEDKRKSAESLSAAKTLENLDLKKKDQESRAFKKLESYFEVVTKDELERKSISQEEEMEYEGMREITQQSIIKGINSSPSLILKCLPQEAEEIHHKIAQLVKKVGDYPTQKIRKSPEQKENILEKPTEILDELNMQLIRDEYRKRMTNPETVNYELIDSMIVRLEFFAKLSKTIRTKLLQKSHLVYYTAGSSLLRKEDNADQMYVILRGAVNVRALKITPNGKKEYVTIAVLRDGHHFGEYTFIGAQKETDDRELKICTHMGTLDLETGEENAPTKQQAYMALKKKHHTACLDHMIEEWALNDMTDFGDKKSQDRPRRTAIIEVAESCDLLCITRSQFQAIFLELIQKELDSKLKLLLCLSFFQKMDPFGLIPLASNLVSRVFTMGDVIVSAGHQVNRLYIISQGRCKVTLKTLRAADPELSQKVLQKQNSIRKSPSDKKLIRSLTKSNSRLSLKFDAGKVYDRETIEVKDGKIFYVEHILCGTLVRGDIIGGRAIISEKDFTEFDRKNGRSMYLGPAKLSVIAESSMVEVFELDQDHAACVSGFLLNIMKNGIKRSKQFDDYEFEKEKKEYEDWAKFKEREVKMAVKSKTKFFEGEVKTS